MRTLASRARRYTASGPSRSSTSSPEATSTSGPDLLPESVITPHGEVVHCHQTVQETRKAGLANPGSSLHWARGGSGLLSDGARGVRQPPPQPPVVELVELVEAEATVERGRMIIDCERAIVLRGQDRPAYRSSQFSGAIAGKTAGDAGTLMSREPDGSGAANAIVNEFRTAG